MPSKRSARSGGRSTRAVAILAAALVLSSFAFSAGPGAAFARAYLVLTPDRLFTQPWTLLTTAWVQPGLGALVASVLALWFFGGPVAAERGTRHFLIVIALGQAIGSLAAAGLGVAIAPRAAIPGAQAAALAATAEFGAMAGGRIIAVFGYAMRASVCALLYLALTVLFLLIALDLTGLAGAVVGAGVGALAGAPAGMLSLRDARQRFRRWRIRRRYRVIPGGRDASRYVH